MSAARAAVTGWAWRTPLGASIDQVVARLLAGERAFAPSHRFPLETYPCSLVAAIPDEPRLVRHRKFLRRLGLLAVEVGLEAFEGAGHGRDKLAGHAPRADGERPGDRLGLFTAVGGLRADWDELMPALASQRPDGEDAWEQGFRLLHPFFMLRYLSNNVHALLAAEIAARGEGVCFGGANAGAQALVSASRALAAGAVDVALVVAYDSLIEPETLVELGARGALARADQAGLAPPYCELARGFVPGEAAAALVLERPGDAGSRALVHLSTADASDGQKGEPLAATLKRALEAVAQGDLIVDGAARGLPDLDRAEREAIASVLGPDAILLATAASMGRVGAAASLVQAIALGNFVVGGALPPIAGILPPDYAGDRGANTTVNGDVSAGDGLSGYIQAFEPLRPLRPLARSMSTAARSAVGVMTGAPGSVGAVRVEVP
jgi:3-oxoacyl-[acyl-carrier-protein] synthase II